MFEDGLLGAVNEAAQQLTSNFSDTSQSELKNAVDYFFNNQENLKSANVDIMQSNDPLKQAHLFKCTPFPGTHWVDTYVRTDGTIVNGHLKTNPDEVTWNNFSASK